MSKSESNDSCSDERRVERAKGIFDGAESIDEMIAQLDQKRDELEQLKEDGWELEDTVVVSDYAHLRKHDE